MVYKDFISDKKQEPLNTVIISNGQEITIKNSITTQDKINIIDITLQECVDNGIYNPLKANVFLTLNMIYKYTDIEFSLEERSEPFELYDSLNRNGLIDEIFDVIPLTQYNELRDIIKSTGLNMMKYGNTIVGFLQNYVNTMPKNAEIAQQLVQNFDSEKWKEAIAFAKALNGDREINNN